MLQCVRHLEGAFPNAQMLPMIQGRIAEQLRDKRTRVKPPTAFSSIANQ